MDKFPCPACRTSLRMAERKALDRPFSCPECKTRLRLCEVGDSIQALPVEEKETALKPAPQRPRSRSWLTPGRVSGMVALLLILGVTLFMMLPEKPVPPPLVTVVPEPEHEEPPVLEPAAAEDSPPARSPLLEKLSDLGRRLNQFRQDKGGWPEPHLETQGPIDQQFSWIAALVAEPGLEPNWQKPWQDPVNEAFVRRRLEPLLNPLIPQLAGEDRYPATHFVGVAGVGPDAPDLPVTHPRAGIFGNSRVARPQDVTDGLSNTLLIAGVQAKLSSWAGHGPGTIRPFTTEPYLQGPDGFGTGQADRMLVLMADGSVREISAETAPVIIRRMAAMADGLALDPDVEGDPLTVPLPPGLAEVKPDEPAPAPVPPEPAPLPLFPTLDTSLAQKLTQFTQPQPVSLRVMLSQLEELIGAPIEVSAATENQLNQPVAVDLKNVTVREVLTAVLKEADLSFEADSMRGILLTKPPR